MSANLETINVDAKDKATFEQLQLKHQAYVGKKLTQAEFFHIIVEAHKRGGI